MYHLVVYSLDFFASYSDITMCLYSPRIYKRPVENPLLVKGGFVELHPAAHVQGVEEAHGSGQGFVVREMDAHLWRKEKFTHD